MVCFACEPVHVSKHRQSFVSGAAYEVMMTLLRIPLREALSLSDSHPVIVTLSLGDCVIVSVCELESCFCIMACCMAGVTRTFTTVI